MAKNVTINQIIKEKLYDIEQRWVQINSNIKSNKQIYKHNELLELLWESLYLCEDIMIKIKKEEYIFQKDTIPEINESNWWALNDL
tara:strand:+ start:166 stop:423 length:258 start_codon:yes stop_codon:yes gene_type:complete